MLGQFLELSLVAPDVRASIDFYRKLGFAEAHVGEAWTHPYAVLTDGRISVGLHQDVSFEPSTTFVKPGLQRHLDRMEHLRLEYEFRRLADDVFNEVGWLDPSGNLIRLVEARTFSPPPAPPRGTSLCGYFVEIALPAPRPEPTKAHWEALGFVGMDEADGLLPRISCTSDTIDVGLYEPAHVQVPTLVFEVDDIGATLARLTQVGLGPCGRNPAPLKHAHAAMLAAPEGTKLLLAERGIG